MWTVKDGNSLFPSSHLKGHPSYDYEDALMKQSFMQIENGICNG